MAYLASSVAGYLPASTSAVRFQGHINADDTLRCDYRRPLGKTGIMVSPVAIGGWQLAGPLTLEGKPDGHTDIGESKAIRLIQSLGKRGINIIDTAAQYGAGEGERRVGKAIAGNRQQWVLVTKAGSSVGPNNERISDISYDGLRQSLNASLSRLQTNYVDVLLCHIPPKTAQEAKEVARFFKDAKAAGQVKATGLSISNSDVQPLKWLHNEGVLDVVQFQNNLNIPANDLFAFIQQHNIGSMVRGILARGALSGKYQEAKPKAFAKDDIRQVLNLDFSMHKKFTPSSSNSENAVERAISHVLDTYPDITNTLLWGGNTLEKYDDVLKVVNHHSKKSTMAKQTSPVGLLTRNDLHEVVALKQAILTDEFGAPAKDLPKTVNQLAGWLDNPASRLWGVKDQAGKVVASGGVFPANVVHQHAFTESTPLIKYLFVDKAYRHQKIASKLLEKIEQFAKMLQAKAILLSTTNASAMALFQAKWYQTGGQLPTTTLSHLRKSMDKEVFMAKPLE
jgi:myo-inositol catabolism protein IolS